MNITKQTEGSKLSIIIEGRLDTTTAPQLDTLLDESLDGVNELVFDIKDMDYVSSAGLRVFLKSQKRMNKQGSMKVTDVQSGVMEIFEVTGFTEILDIE